MKIFQSVVITALVTLFSQQVDSQSVTLVTTFGENGRLDMEEFGYPNKLIYDKGDDYIFLASSQKDRDRISPSYTYFTDELYKISINTGELDSQFGKKGKWRNKVNHLPVRVPYFSKRWFSFTEHILCVNMETPTKRIVEVSKKDGSYQYFPMINFDQIYGSLEGVTYSNGDYNYLIDYPGDSLSIISSDSEEKLQLRLGDNKYFALPRSITSSYFENNFLFLTKKFDEQDTSSYCEVHLVNNDTISLIDSFSLKGFYPYATAVKSSNNSPCIFAVTRDSIKFYYDIFNEKKWLSMKDLYPLEDKEISKSIYSFLASSKNIVYTYNYYWYYVGEGNSLRSLINFDWFITKFDFEAGSSKRYSMSNYFPEQARINHIEYLENNEIVVLVSWSEKTKKKRRRKKIKEVSYLYKFKLD